ncbi:MAG: O-antigen ligase family protein [Planctomycetes bacterium]|nr:O-antigen ligase family protein [Planctomycetota bacterium]
MAPLLLLFAVLLAVDPMVFEQPHLKEGVLLFLGPLVLLRSAWSGTLRRAAAAPLTRPLLALAALTGLWTVLAAVATANVPDAIRACGCLLVGLLVLLEVHETSYDRPLRLPAALLLAGALAAALALLQAAGLDFPFADPDGANPAVSFFGNTNLTGEFLAPIVPLACVLAAGAPARLRALALAALALALAALVLTGSRGAMLAAALGLCFALLLARGLVRGRLFNVPVLAALLAGAVLAFLVGGAEAFRAKTIATSPASIASPEYPTNRQRLALARATLDLARAAPLLGHGPGSFRSSFPPFRDPEEAAIPTLAGARSEAEDPHNQYLLFLAEGGIVSLLLFLGLVLPALFAFRGAALLPEGDARRVAAAAQAAALLALLAVALFRSPLEHPPSALLFFLLCGALLPYRGSVLTDERPRRPPGFLSRILPLYMVALAALGLLALGADLAQGMAHRLTESASTTGNRAHLLRAERWLAFAATLDPGGLDTLQLRAATLRILGKGGESRVAEEEAVHRRILALYPWHEASLLRLGGILADEDRVQAARSSLRRALELRRGAKPASAEDMAELLARSGHARGAARLLFDEVRRGALPAGSLRRAADEAKASGAEDLEFACHEAILELYPYDGDSAFRAGEIETARNRPEAARRLYARAHVSFALEFLGQRDYEAAREAAERAARHEALLEAEVLSALAAVGEGDKGAVERLRAERPEPLPAEFMRALRLLEGNGDLAPAVRALAGAE